MLPHGWRLLPWIVPLLAHASGASAQVGAPGRSGGLSVAPVHLSLGDTRRSVSATVTNPGAVPITVQARLYGWTMRGEEEVYAPATDAGFSPPLFRLEPHAAQAVRVVARVPAGAAERSYRLVIDQLPLADAPGQLQLPVRMVLPVFVEPVGGGHRAAVLEWSARYDTPARRVILTVVNRGAVHARIVDLAVDDGRGPVPVARGLAGYALAGQARDWSYPAEAAPARLTVAAGDSGVPRVTIPVAR